MSYTAGLLLYICSSMLNATTLTDGVNNNTLAVLVNINDPESQEIAKYYQKVRQIPTSNIIYLDFKTNVNSLSEAEFLKVNAQLKSQVPDVIQAYALAWRKPWKVECMSITSAFSLGFNREYCARGCKSTKVVEYFNSPSMMPYSDYSIRPSMLLSAKSVESVKRLIDSGYAADYMRPAGSAYLLSTSDSERNVRSVAYHATQFSLRNLLNVELIGANEIANKDDIMFYFTGSEVVRKIHNNYYLPGAAADHLTSYGGQLFGGKQMSVLEWIEAGVTGTYGTVVEPCNMRQKFPHPGILMQSYLSGNSLIESYWKSVQMPGQGVFVGEPLASPFKGCKLTFNKQNIGRYENTVASNYVDQKSRNCN